MSGRVRIVIPDDHPPVFAGTDALDALHELGEVALYETPAPSRDLVVERCRDAAFVVNIRSITPFDAETLAALPLLRLIAVFGAGTDNIDLAAATRQGIAVANAPGANARSVAEHAFALLLAVARAVPAYDRDVRVGLWQHSYEGLELEGKTLGLLGLGQIGGHVARIATGFGMRVLAWSRSTDEARAARLGVEQASLNTVLVSADAIVVEDALVAALRTGALRGAGLDVFATEPLPLSSPLRDPPNLVLTPHAGWATREARQRLLRSPVENIRAFLDGQPKNLVGTGR